MQPLATHSLYELQLLALKPEQGSVLALLNQARTFQGKEKLTEWLRSPLTSVAHIQERQRLMQFVAGQLPLLTIEVSQGYLTAALNHLLSNWAWYASRLRVEQYWKAQWWRWFRPYDYYQLRAGTTALQLVLRTIDQQTTGWHQQMAWPDQLRGLAQTLDACLAPLRPWLYGPLTRSTLLRVDYLLRCQHVEQVKTVLDVFYQLDAYCGLGRFLNTVDWAFPVFTETPTPAFHAVALRHPLLPTDSSVSNDLELAPYQNLALLTGGNMSGKTTFLKACGLAVYLAHLGLPVPARSMQLSFFDCLKTSIHLSDDLTAGYSHFYTELLRIKDAADTLATGQRVLLIADELFRGTNPDDALLCARQVIDKLLAQPRSLCLVSSHLASLSTQYQRTRQVQCCCFRTQVADKKLTFSYRLESGSAAERTGVLLLEQAGVLASLP